MMDCQPIEVAHALVGQHGLSALLVALGLYDDAPPEEETFWVAVCWLLYEAESTLQTH